jgi:hypothetical protein
MNCLLENSFCFFDGFQQKPVVVFLRHCCCFSPVNECNPWRQWKENSIDTRQSYRGAVGEETATSAFGVLFYGTPTTAEKAACTFED